MRQVWRNQPWGHMTNARPGGSACLRGLILALLAGVAAGCATAPEPGAPTPAVPVTKHVPADSHATGCPDGTLAELAGAVAAGDLSRARQAFTEAYRLELDKWQQDTGSEKTLAYLSRGLKNIDTTGGYLVVQTMKRDNLQWSTLYGDCPSATQAYEEARRAPDTRIVELVFAGFPWQFESGQWRISAW